MNLFGFEIKRAADSEQQLDNTPSFVPETADDGAVIVAAGGAYGTYVDLEGTVKTEAQLVNRYRDMSMHPEVDSAIDDIVNEAIVNDPDEDIVKMNLDRTGLSDNIKKLFQKEFTTVLELLNFNSQCYDIFRRWYVDGRLYYHVVIDIKSPELGIQELRYVDPRRLRKIKEVRKRKDPKTNINITDTKAEYYLFSEKNFSDKASSASSSPAAGIKIAKDSIVHITSGLMDVSNSLVLSNLHKAIKALNQLRTLEDAAVIYRISRAPERRIFYVDVGNLPKMKAEQYLRDIMIRHKNRLVYDASNGEIRDDRKFMTLLEDYWFPRREGGRGTEVQTLPPGQNLGEMGDILYFQENLYKALNVPTSRLKQDTAFALGRSTEISRDEVKFARFIGRLRLKFTSLFLKCLERQLILKGIINSDDWDNISSRISFDFNRDNYFAELKESEIFTERLNLLALADQYTDKYFSHNWIRRVVLRQSDEEIERQDEIIKQEMDDPQYNPPPEQDTEQDSEPAQQPGQTIQ
jgi:hypothetical protein